MGTYYRYVNHTRREFVRLSGVRAGGDKTNAVVWCGGVLAYLMLPPSDLVEYRGRWGSDVARPGGALNRVMTLCDAQAVAIVSDGAMDFFEMEQPGSADYQGYVDITKPLVEDMRQSGYWDGYAHAQGDGVYLSAGDEPAGGVAHRQLRIEHARLLAEVKELRARLSDPRTVE